jgi:anti-sigma factor RsiW
MDHEAAQALFSDYLDGELAAAERAQVDAHLADCIPCRSELEDMKRTLAALRGAKVEAPPEVSPEFMDELRSQIRTRSKGRFFGDKKRSYRVEIASLVTLLVATTLYVILSLVQPMWLVR